MFTEAATYPFPTMLVFPDVDPQVLSHDEGEVMDARRMLEGAWMEYMQRMLPPVVEQAA
jgi:hypothetical protein